MKKQIFTIILFTVVSLNVWGQSFKLDATGANDMRLRTNSLDRLNILTNGNVGINKTTPIAKLDLNGDLALTKKLTYSTVGIQNALDRQGASRIYVEAFGTVTLNGIAGGQDGLIIFLYTSTSSTLIINNNNPSALVADQIATHTGTTVTITGRGGVSMIYDASVSSWRIFGFADENSTWNANGNAGTNPTTNFIGTTDAQGFVVRTNNTERMRFLSGGNVGIGTTTPDTQFHVEGTVDNNGTTATFKVTNAGTSMLFDGNEIDGASNGAIFLNNNSTGNTVVATGGGKVGIGTSNPTAKLDVEGDIVIKKTTFSGTGIQNALSRTGGSSLYFTGGGTVTLNGIAGGVDGMLLYIITSLGTTLVINNESASAVATNRITTHTGATVTITARGGATLIYESTTGLWRIIGIAN